MMKTTLFLLAGVSLGLASWLLTRTLRPSAGAAPTSVDELTKDLQQAWADHHTVA